MPELPMTAAAYFGAIDTVRGTVRWTVAAFAAIAAVVVGTGPLTNVGSLTLWSTRWWWALAASLVALVMAGVVIGCALHVLQPAENNIEKLDDEIKGDIDASSAALFNRAGQGIRTCQALANAWKIARDNGDQQRQDELAPIVEAVEAQGLWCEVRGRWHRFLGVAGIAAFIAAVALFVFSWAANPAKP